MPDDAIRKICADAGASFLNYGAGADTPGIPVVEVFSSLDFEYAALRKGSAIIDLPHRGVILATGADRGEFLQRMVTQRLPDVPTQIGGQKVTPAREHGSPSSGGWCVRSFWLNRRGRIDADLLIAEPGGTELPMLIDADALVSVDAASSLNEYVFTEDAAFEDASKQWRRMAVHGPDAWRVLTAAASVDAGDAPLANGVAGTLKIDEVPVVFARHDTAGVPGFELFVRSEKAAAVFESLADLGAEATHAALPATDRSGKRRRARPIGWLAYNTARIEGGTPFFMIDYDSKAVPAETSLLNDRVDFKKGCYLGQEVVARMHAQGRPKQRLVSLRPPRGAAPPPTEGPDHQWPQPLGGTPVYSVDAPTETPIGAVTSSTVSPMLGGMPVAFAMLRFAMTEPGTRVMVAAEGHRLEMEVQESLSVLEVDPPAS